MAESPISASGHVTEIIMLIFLYYKQSPETPGQTQSSEVFTALHALLEVPNER